MKKLLSASVAAATFSMGLAAPAMAEVPGLSANVGLVSDYYYRGNHLGVASPYVGLDYEVAGFYVGTWAIDDGVGGTGNNGLEVDYYFGYGVEAGDFSVSVGFTGYEYTYTEDSEAEIGISLGFKGLALDYYVGTDNNPTGGGDDIADYDYQFFTLGYSYDIYGVTYGNYEIISSDANMLNGDGYQYLELSAGGEVATLDMAVTIGRKFGVEAGGVTTTSGGGEYIVLDISKSFSF